MKEDLEKLLQYLIMCKENNKRTGLCTAIMITYTGQKDTNLFKCIESNRPSKDLHPQFYDEDHHKQVIWSKDSVNYWWPFPDIDVRIEYVKHLITLQ